MRVQALLIVGALTVVAIAAILWGHLDGQPRSLANVTSSCGLAGPAQTPETSRRYSPANSDPVKPPHPVKDRLPANEPEQPKPLGDSAPLDAEPERQPPNIADALQVPILDPSLTDAEYEAIEKNPDRSREERAEARKKRWAHFASWGGRNSGQLGGFYFKQSDYRELDGWKAPTESYLEERTTAGQIERVSYRTYFTGAFCVRRNTCFINGSKTRTTATRNSGVDILVANSAYWAQQEMLTHCSGKYGGDAPEFQIGDNSFVDSSPYSGAVYFTRNNVFVKIAGVGGTGMDVETALALARSIDRQIVAQAVAARDWSELADIRPQIQRFDFSTYKLSTKVGYYPKLVYAEFSDPRPAAKGHFVKSLPLDEKYPIGLGWSAGENGNPGQGSADYHDAKETTTTRVWLVVYNESLLFSVAERTVEIVADGAPENK